MLVVCRNAEATEHVENIGMEMNRNSGINNPSESSSGRIKSIYMRGADDGFGMGLYFCGMFALSVCALSVPAVNVALAVMALGVPFLTYFFLRRTHVAAHGLTLFSSLWMQGIVMFACGCLIFGFAGVIYLHWIDPGFMRRVLQMGVDFYNSADTEASRAMAAEFQMVIDSKAIPSAVEVVLGWMWLGMFSGSLLSMLVAGLVRMKKVPVG